MTVIHFWYVKVSHSRVFVRNSKSVCACNWETHHLRGWIIIHEVGKLLLTGWHLTPSPNDRGSRITNVRGATCRVRYWACAPIREPLSVHRQQWMVCLLRISDSDKSALTYLLHCSSRWVHALWPSLLLIYASNQIPKATSSFRAFPPVVTARERKKIGNLDVPAARENTGKFSDYTPFWTTVKISSSLRHLRVANPLHVDEYRYEDGLISNRRK